MTAAGAPTVLLSLSDVAALASVQRPVVSMWRSRSARSDQPFPDPVTSVRGRFRFDAAEVAAWLEATGHGNNPDAAADAAVFGVPDGISEDDDETLGAGMSAVLCLKALVGGTLGDRSMAELTTLAARTDPHDEMLLSEIRSLEDRLLPLARWADIASDAAYSVEAAFDRLLARRQNTADAQPAGSSRPALAAPLPSLVGALARALSVELAADPPTYADVTPGGGELMLSVLAGSARAVDVDTAATVLLPDTGGREARRRLLVHGIHPTTVPTDGGRFEVDGPVVHLLQLTADAAGGLRPERALTAVDDVQLQMDDGQRAIVVAPASVLCDRLADRELDRQRDHLLRLGRVRAVVRLPEGLVTTSPRQRLALWVLGAAHADVGVDMRWTAVADLADVSLSDAVIDDVVSDLVAAMGNQQMVRAHAFRFVRLRQTSVMLAGRRALVGPGVAATKADRTPAADQAMAVAQLREVLQGDEPRDPLAGVDVMVRQGDPVDPAVSIGTAVDQGLVRVVSGSRVDPMGLPEGQVPVISVGALVADDHATNRAVDALALEAAYPAARRTEPGDVVFCTSPRPRAHVDADGGSVVVYPARVLRIVEPRSSGLVPQVVVTDINQQPATARAWRAWRVRRVPLGQVDAVASALASLQREEERARARAAQVNRLSELVVQGVASRALALTSTGDDVTDPERRS